MKGFKRKFVVATIVGLMVTSVSINASTGLWWLGDLFSYLESSLAHMVVVLHYDSLDKKYPELVCTKCNQFSISLGELSGAIEARGLKALIDGKSDGSDMKRLLDESTKLLQKGSFEAIEAFMLRIANDIYTCGVCEAAAWGKKG